jgi:hypothetical protein
MEMDDRIGEKRATREEPENKIKNVENNFGQTFLPIFVHCVAGG